MLEDLCLRRLPSKVLNIRVRAFKPLVFLANILNILNINTLHSSDITTIYMKYIYIKYIVAILLHVYGVYSCDITVCIVAIAAYNGMPRYIIEVIRLRGGNEYREGRKGGDKWLYDLADRVN